MFTDVGLQDFPHHDAAWVVSFQVRCKLEVLALSNLYWEDDLSQITIQTIKFILQKDLCFNKLKYLS